MVTVTIVGIPPTRIGIMIIHQNRIFTIKDRDIMGYSQKNKQQYTLLSFGT